MHSIYELTIILKILKELPKPLFVSRSVDKYPVEVTKQDIDKFLIKGRS